MAGCFNRYLKSFLVFCFDFLKLFSFLLSRALVDLGPQTIVEDLDIRAAFGERIGDDAEAALRWARRWLVDGCVAGCNE